MEKEKGQASAEPLKTSLVCPRCGEAVNATPLLSTVFCGVRIQASCDNDCTWTHEEQQEMNRAASEEVYT